MYVLPGGYELFCPSVLSLASMDEIKRSFRRGLNQGLAHLHNAVKADPPLIQQSP